MIPLIALLVAAGATFFGFRGTRDFVRRRLRYVDSIHAMRAPWVAGTAATLIAAPVVWALPVIGAGTAILFGIGVGSGFAAGAKDVNREFRSLPRM